MPIPEPNLLREIVILRLKEFSLGIHEIISVLFAVGIDGGKKSLPSWQAAPVAAVPSLKTWSHIKFHHHFTRSVQEINPAIDSRIKGLPGIKIRLNRRAFKYASILIGHIFDNEVLNANLPLTSHCFTEVNGCIEIFNQFISRYRCPQRIAIYPVPPNRLIIDVQNVDTRVSGNIDGQIQIVLPLPINGIVHVSIHQLSIMMELQLLRGQARKFQVSLTGCFVSIGYVDIYIESGGVLGDVFNNQFRSKASETARSIISKQMCRILSETLPRKVNTMFELAPESIDLTQFGSIAESILRNMPRPAYCESDLCKKRLNRMGRRRRIRSPLALPPEFASSNEVQQEVEELGKEEALKSFATKVIRENVTIKSQTAAAKKESIENTINTETTMPSESHRSVSITKKTSMKSPQKSRAEKPAVSQKYASTNMQSILQTKEKHITTAQRLSSLMVESSSTTRQPEIYNQKTLKTKKQPSMSQRLGGERTSQALKISYTSERSLRIEKYDPGTLQPSSSFGQTQSSKIFKATAETASLKNLYSSSQKILQTQKYTKSTKQPSQRAKYNLTTQKLMTKEARLGTEQSIATSRYSVSTERNTTRKYNIGAKPPSPRTLQSLVPETLRLSNQVKHEPSMLETSAKKVSPTEKSSSTKQTVPSSAQPDVDTAGAKKTFRIEKFSSVTLMPSSSTQRNVVSKSTRPTTQRSLQSKIETTGRKINEMETSTKEIAQAKKYSIAAMKTSSTTKRVVDTITLRLTGQQSLKSQATASTEETPQTKKYSIPTTKLSSSTRRIVDTITLRPTGLQSLKSQTTASTEETPQTKKYSIAAIKLSSSTRRIVNTITLRPNGLQSLKSQATASTEEIPQTKKYSIAAIKLSSSTRRIVNTITLRPNGLQSLKSQTTASTEETPQTKKYSIAATELSSSTRRIVDTITLRPTSRQLLQTQTAASTEKIPQTAKYSIERARSSPSTRMPTDSETLRSISPSLQLQTTVSTDKVLKAKYDAVTQKPYSITSQTSATGKVLQSLKQLKSSKSSVLVSLDNVVQQSTIIQQSSKIAGLSASTTQQFESQKFTTTTQKSLQAGKYSSDIQKSTTSLLTSSTDIKVINSQRPTEPPMVMTITQKSLVAETYSSLKPHASTTEKQKIATNSQTISLTKMFGLATSMPSPEVLLSSTTTSNLQMLTNAAQTIVLGKKCYGPGIRTLPTGSQQPSSTGKSWTAIQVPLLPTKQSMRTEKKRPCMPWLSQNESFDSRQPSDTEKEPCLPQLSEKKPYNTEQQQFSTQQTISDEKHLSQPSENKPFDTRQPSDVEKEPCMFQSPEKKLYSIEQTQFTTKQPLPTLQSILTEQGQPCMLRPSETETFSTRQPLGDGKEPCMLQPPDTKLYSTKQPRFSTQQSIRTEEHQPCMPRPSEKGLFDTRQPSGIEKEPCMSQLPDKKPYSTEQPRFTTQQPIPTEERQPCIPRPSETKAFNFRQPLDDDKEPKKQDPRTSSMGLLSEVQKYMTSTGSTREVRYNFSGSAQVLVSSVRPFITSSAQAYPKKPLEIESYGLALESTAGTEKYDSDSQQIQYGTQQPAVGSEAQAISDTVMLNFSTSKILEVESAATEAQIPLFITTLKGEVLVPNLGIIKNPQEIDEFGVIGEIEYTLPLYVPRSPTRFPFDISKFGYNKRMKRNSEQGSDRAMNSGQSARRMQRRQQIDPCAKCKKIEDDPIKSFTDLLHKTNTKSINEIALTTRIIEAFATPNDYTISLTGEFSPRGRGSVPFSAFPMSFPDFVGEKMVETLISDHTFNTLFYHLHRKKFITLKVDTGTPKIGPLLKTTCNDDDDFDFDDTGVEIDEETGTPPTRSKRGSSDESDLASLGICLGDIMPAVKEKYPKQDLYIIFRSTRAPSVTLSSKNGGTASLDILIDAEIYILDTNIKVGTIQVAGIIDIRIKSDYKRLTGSADLRLFKLKDLEGTLGLPEDALNNLAKLAQEAFVKLANASLREGVELWFPTTHIPITLIDIQLKIVDHGIYVASDIILSRSLIPIFDRSCRYAR